MQVLLQHRTQYQYEIPTFLTTHLIRLKPAAHCRTPIDFYKLKVQPNDHTIHWQQDPFGNFLARVDFLQPMLEFIIEVNIIANLIPVNPFDFFIDDYAQYFPFEYEAQLKKDLSPYFETEDKGPIMLKWMEKVDTSKRETINFLDIVTRKTYEEITYTTRMQPGVQTSDESLNSASGSCRDSAWLLVQTLRNLGLAARFVSGYLVQLTPQLNSINIQDSDTVSLHAWAEVYIPGAGWIGLDATSGLFTGEGHIPLACTPGFESAAPVTGTSGISKTTFTYHNKITRL